MSGGCEGPRARRRTHEVPGWAMSPPIFETPGTFTHPVVFVLLYGLAQWGFAARWRPVLCLVYGLARWGLAAQL